MSQLQLLFDENTPIIYSQSDKLEENYKENKFQIFNEFSQRILDEFNADPQLVMCDYPELYSIIAKIIPTEKISFDTLPLDSAIACEIICAAICHKINWDFLRSEILKKTNDRPEWLNPFYLKNINEQEVLYMLSNYKKKERIKAKERTEILNSLGEILLKKKNNFIDILCNEKHRLKDFDSITAYFKEIRAFSNDPEEKKLRLVIQKISHYEGFQPLRNYISPTIDYHIIRSFLRRGLIIPRTIYAAQYIFDVSKGRKENTIASLRKLCSSTIKNISAITTIDIYTINQIEWWIGRSVCLGESPDCTLRYNDSQWLRPYFKKCPFYNVCMAINNKDYISLIEPKYTGNSY